MAALPIQRLYHANVVVHDLRATARNYARILGIARWDVRRHPPDSFQQAQAFGYRAEFGYATASGANEQGVTFRLVQPTHGFSTYAEYLLTRGEGIHSFCATVLDPPRMHALMGALPEHGLSVAQAVSRDGTPASVLVDTRAQLGGYYVEIVSGEPGPVDEEWDFTAEAAQRPAAVEWLAHIPKIGHFGVAVASLSQRLPRYARVLGVEGWSGVHFHHAPGSLEHATVHGQVVRNAWLIALTDVADFGLELLQGTQEPTDYRQTIDRIGEGIHHVLVRRDLPDPDWWALRAWLERMDIGVVMSGRVRYGAAEFFYLDTRAALGGYLLEVIVPGQTRAEAPSSGPTDTLARFELDFSTPAG